MSPSAVKRVLAEVPSLILIVDDEPGICEANEVLLADLGYRTAVARSGREAIRQARAHRPDLILLDVTMPDMDGFAACRALREEKAAADTPIIFVTARCDPAQKVEAFELGACDYVTKPFDQDELAARIRAHLARRVRAQQEIEEAERAGRTLRAELRQAGKMAALGELLSGVAHEINNPLTSVLGFAQLVTAQAEASGNAALAEDCRKLAAAAERTARIARNLLGFARKKEPDARPIDLNEVVRSALEFEVSELKLAQVTAECQLADRLPSVLGDFQQLMQVVLNLVTNARQAITSTKRGHGRIVVRTETTSLPGGAAGVRLEVADDGPGMPPEHLARIFDPFFTTKPEGQGTGLGLSLCQDVVRHHEGQIRAESTAGQGARFIVELPALA
jgi:signal transduction histidine kinase